MSQHGVSVDKGTETYKCHTLGFTHCRPFTFVHLLWTKTYDHSNIGIHPRNSPYSFILQIGFLDYIKGSHANSVKEIKHEHVHTNDFSFLQNCKNIALERHIIMIINVRD